MSFECIIGKAQLRLLKNGKHMAHINFKTILYLMLKGSAPFPFPFKGAFQRLYEQKNQNYEIAKWHILLP